MNYVCIIGVLIEKNDSYLIIKVDSELIKVFISDLNINLLDINSPIKIEGKIKNIGFPFEVVLVEKIYTLKEDIQ